MAGTTVRDDGSVLAAFDAALTALGLAPGSPELARAREYALATMGQSKIEVFRVIVDGDEARARRANAAFEDAYARHLAGGGASPIPGAEEAILRLRSAGVRVALTTGFGPDTRDALLDALGWGDLVDLALAPADAGGRGRPYPDMILTAVLRLRVDDVTAVAVAGDTASDLLAGTRAGAGVVAGVLTGAHGEAEFATVAHTHVLGSVAELPDVIERAAGLGAPRP
ncbi:HAD family hydrolase [Frankia nepalensis]|uniref:HAD family hydrolase n=1 Tax=Frankia nepalensis TaxID=1836974 RepID=A0A937UV81_9ACTN|nr:HAD family hydrolase [Frankia nepalensis]